MELEHILVVDDDRLSVELLHTLLEQEHCRVSCAFNGRQAWELFRKDPADVVFMDLRMPGMGGMDLLKKARESSPRTVIVIMTTCATVESVVNAMKLGAYDYVVKPFEATQIRMLLQRLRERNDLYAQNDYLKSELAAERSCDELITQDEQMLHICEAAKRAANSKASVLIQGESGTGKELIARLIHEHSPRKSQPLINVHCAALPEGLLESELFGHEKGSFPSAAAHRTGRLELADGGTLLLDEISEIPVGLQAKLLRVLEEEQFERVGGSATLRVDVRVIATTSRDLRAAIAESAFREDLYYRLNVIPMVLPPLRARNGDVPLLTSYFLKRYAEEHGRTVPRLSDEARRILCRHTWPGNVRELKNLIQRLIVLGPGDTIEAEHIPPGVRGAAPASPSRRDSVAVGQTIEQAERWLILKTLQHTAGNRTEAADILGVTTRTLRNKLSRYRQGGLISDLDMPTRRKEHFSYASASPRPTSISAAAVRPGTPFAEWALPA